MRRSKSETLNDLRSRKIELENKIKDLAAQERAASAQREVRKKMVVGAVALDHWGSAPESSFAATLLGLLNENVRGSADRALFNLPPLTKKESAPTEGA